LIQRVEAVRFIHPVAQCQPWIIPAGFYKNHCSTGFDCSSKSGRFDFFIYFENFTKIEKNEQ
jgi:hypothetical protein